MKALERVQQKRQKEGTSKALLDSTNFLFRLLRHKVARNGLHHSAPFHRLLVWWNAGRGEYEAVADPFKIIFVDPQRIECVSGRGPFPGQFQFEDLGLICDGDWDLEVQPFENIPIVEALKDRYQCEKDWEEIPYFRHILRGDQRGHGRWDVRSKEEMEEVWNEIDELSENIKEHGYMTRRELVERGMETPDRFLKGDGLGEYNEVCVDIGRDGRLLFVDGRHRLTLAKILDISEIPVRISARHAKWQEIREAISNHSDRDLSKDVKEHLGHPDLAEFEGTSSKGAI